jgi:hypothetical protein
MRYRSGSIEISRGHDLPLLRQVIESQFVSHSQLFTFMNLGCYESKRRSFNWRLGRLLEHGLLQRHNLACVCGDPLYTITKSGIACLEIHGEYYPAAFPISNGRAEEFSVIHALELNEIHLVLLRRNELRVTWIPEIKIRTSDRFGTRSYAKEYDAIVEIWLAEKSISFALEYERTQKRVDDYLRICELLEHERNLRLFVYLMPTHELIGRVARYFSGSKRRVLFCVLNEFKDRLLEANVSDTRSIRLLSLRQAFSQT